MISRKLTAAVLARECKTTVHTVRHYTRKGLLNPERDPGNHYRLYRPRDFERLRFIWRAQRLGFELREIRDILAHAETGQTPCPQVRDILQQRVSQNRRQLDAMRALQARMEQALVEWQTLPDAVPTGDLVCHLIESFSDQAIEHHRDGSDSPSENAPPLDLRPAHRL